MNNIPPSITEKKVYFNGALEIYEVIWLYLFRLCVFSNLLFMKQNFSSNKITNHVFIPFFSSWDKFQNLGPQGDCSVQRDFIVTLGKTSSTLIPCSNTRTCQSLLRMFSVNKSQLEL